jgi:hypothetical protein
VGAADDAAGVGEPGVAVLEGNGEPDDDVGTPEAGADGDECEGEAVDEFDGGDDGVVA